MSDLLSFALQSATHRNALGPAVVFAAGAATSAGPCIAPRLLAVAGVVARANRRAALALTAAFSGGLLTAYASFGAAAALLSRVFQFSSLTYGIVALAMFAAGVASLWRGDKSCCAETAPQSASAGAVFLLGASFALVLSPCCTPVMSGILALTSAAGDPAYGIALMASFALGHLLPVFFAALGSKAIYNLIGRYAVRDAALVVSATLMLALAGYYMVLA